MSDSALSASRKKKRPLMMILLLLIAIGACGAAGYAWWMLHKQQSGNGTQTAETKKQEPAAAPIFLALDTFTVNLQTTDNDPDRVLYIGLTLRLPDEQNRATLNEYLPEVRSRLLLLLSRQKTTDLVSEAGKQQLVQDIKQVLDAPLVKGQPPQVINDVLFTAFILR
ncbi:flagellar basal body-associated protein FliL [Rahnella aquatilis]|uniref:Flagellar protein FliL n=1 Tax=Rahnella aquatilis (strain ATCC 33071 / DSM 4594 / JCM 1683 / NBRC 105701 / NCIMB 13365 / CIP 78.65) TaxID=745277 RepID=H2IQ22_RAHAC|nr:flagellar basal body-associated protein FliL [Rahnella aquatilis]AEX52407.1 flagellar basal body-associated protein [Rahnella aquatilis CIP 78.65 = ATCC 33071]KFD07876.1 FliL family flagellar biosynthesis protein [Rahnella aquatilis CIP 78.65 = ATCC 33071]